MVSRTKTLNVELFNRLRDLLGPKKVSHSELDKVAYSKDMWPLGQLWTRSGEVKYKPDFVVWPETTEEVSRLVKTCNETGYPLIPYGAGSGVCGGAVPVDGGIVCDLKKMNRIDAVNDKSLLATVQTGIIGEHLERRLNHKGYTLGHFPSSIYSSTLGGYLATRSAGQLSTKYGKIEDMAVSLQVVLPDGEIVRTRTAPRSATGPNFNQLFLGSEGTLGIITKATLRIHPKPEKRVFQSYLFEGVEKGCRVIRKALQMGITPAVVRLYDKADTALSLEAIDFQQEIKGCLLILIHEGWPRRCELESEMVDRICKEESGKNIGQSPAKHWWKNRYAINYKQSLLLSSEKMIFDTVEVATTWTNLLNLHQSMKSALGDQLTVLAHFSHAYRDGCSIYFTIMGQSEDMPDTEFYHKIWQDALDACIKAGGTISHHHGVGILKAKWMERQLGSWMKVYAGIKKRLDPNNILNPHKMGLP